MVAIATLSIYISRQFLGAVLGMLLALAGLVVMFDFIELLRRSATKPDATFGLVSEIAALRLPYIAMQILPFAILLVHAALQGIPRDLYEQAAVDGASAWQRFWKITLPLLRPIIAVILILRTSFAFAVFEEILAITQGGPGDATWVAAWYSYKMSFAPPNNFGLGAASAYVLAMMIGALAIFYVRVVYRRVTL